MNDVDVEDLAITELDAKQARSAAVSARARERRAERAAIEEISTGILEAVGRMQVLAERGGSEAARAKRRQILRGVRVGLQLMAEMRGEEQAFKLLQGELLDG